MKRTVTVGLAVAILAAWAAPAMAQRTIQVRIKNISKQIISPPLVASHTWKGAVFRPGHPATPELSMLAEDGGPGDLAALLEADGEVLDVATASGPLMPGSVVTLDLEVGGRFNRISAVGMLVTTNDAFFGLQSYVVTNDSFNQRVTAPAWDAGTEFNNELCAFIPGPPCGNPMVRDTTDAEGFVHVHPGLHGVGDVSPAQWDWQNPVVNIVVVKK
jgi:hypothetical protein